MELRHLRYFTAVVECKGYREASRRLHIAQPSISEAVSDLEHELGLKLFSRTHRNARVTPEGEIFYMDAVRILQQAETAILTAKRAAQGEVGRLSIGFIGAATLSFLPDLIRRYKLEYPNIKLALHDLYPVELDKACDRGEIDIAITRPLSMERRKNRQSRVLLRDPLVAVLPQSRKLKLKDKKIRLGDAKRDRVYCATALLDILEEPGHLKPPRSSPGCCSMAAVSIWVRNGPPLPRISRALKTYLSPEFRRM